MRSRNNSREDPPALFECSCSGDGSCERSLDHGLDPPVCGRFALPSQSNRNNKNDKNSSGHAKKRLLRLYVDWKHSENVSLFLAVALWYSLGVISISTSKLLLTPSRHHTHSLGYYSHVGGLSPLVLTLQQLLLGSTLLRFLLSVRFLNSPGLQPWGALGATTENPTRTNKPSIWRILENEQSIISIYSSLHSIPNRHLLMAAVSFSLGFLATNLGFSGTTAAFVETVKAAEPITSAVLAVSWGLEELTVMEISSLASIVAGVLLSTLGNSGPATTASTAGNAMWSSVLSCFVVMTSNLCFSFRGLYQKLFRRDGGTFDAMNLQFRMQYIGVVLLSIPTMLWEGSGIATHVYHVLTDVRLLRSEIILRFCSLALLNGFAFTCYNLASTYLLSRITVVHHAALNCVRRIFAIIVTSVIFVVPITFTGFIGIVVSFAGFMAFTYAKSMKVEKTKPSSRLLPMGDHCEEHRRV